MSYKLIRWIDSTLRKNTRDTLKVERRNKAMRKMKRSRDPESKGGEHASRERLLNALVRSSCRQHLTGVFVI